MTAKHTAGVTKLWLCAGAAWAVFASSASAQFHQRSDSGRTVVNPQTVPPSHQASAARAGEVRSHATTSTSSGGGTASSPLLDRRAQMGSSPGQGSAIYVSEDHERAFGARIGEQESGFVHVWGRAIYHPDGSFTESKQDTVTNTLEQVTKSENGTRMQRRMIMLDATGRPVESLIYDGRDNFRYRGTLVYDPYGRLSEEQICDAEGNLIRRNVQEYGPRGQRLPLRSVDYVANVPEDLRLVISEAPEDSARTDPSPSGEQEGRNRGGKGGGGLFRGQRPSGADQTAVPNSSGKASGSSSRNPNPWRFFSGNRER